MPNTTSAACVPVRVKMRLQAIGLWAFLSIPSIVVTILLFVWTIDGEKVRHLFVFSSQIDVLQLQ